VLEIFSAQARAFGERELRTLQMLSRSVVENIELARRASSRVEAAVPAGGAGEEKHPHKELEPVEAGAAEIGEATERIAGVVPATADIWTGALMVAVVVLAVTLGWMVGRGGRHGSQANALRQTDAVSQNKSDAKPDAVAGSAVKPAAPGVASGGSSGELVVYQNGQMVFPKAPEATNARPQPSTPAADVKAAVETSKIQASGPVRIPPDVAASYVTSRVEPEYPEQARAQRLQGAVELDALIGKDGRVQRFAGIRGDPELAAAASAAVRQWRFKPYVRNGQSEDFETRITVDFRLP
jgi:TonB family protein